MNDPERSIAVLLPCFNEETTITQVVSDFRKSLPQARIYVFDNASTDRTAQLACDAGATVIFSKNPGKGNVVCPNSGNRSRFDGNAKIRDRSAGDVFRHRREKFESR